MSETFLTSEELAELTGRTKKGAQKTVLRRNRIKYFENALGYPVVMMEALKRHLEKEKPKNTDEQDLLERLATFNG